MRVTNIAMLQGLCWTIIFFGAFQSGNGKAVAILLKHGSPQEIQTKVQLERLLSEFDLQPWTFTQTVMIDQTAIPHSSPVLTLHTRHLNSDDLLMSTYVHEQIHWFLDSRESNAHLAEEDLEKVYPSVPVGYPDGADSQQATYEHLIVCYLEMKADREILGEKRGTEVVRFWATDHYRWVYRTVLQDEQIIGKVISKHRLQIDLPRSFESRLTPRIE